MIEKITEWLTWIGPWNTILVFLCVIPTVILLVWGLIVSLRAIDWEDVAYRFNVWLAHNSDDELFDATWMDAEKYQATRLPELKRKHYQPKH